MYSIVLYITHYRYKIVIKLYFYIIFTTMRTHDFYSEKNHSSIQCVQIFGYHIKSTRTKTKNSKKTKQNKRNVQTVSSFPFFVFISLVFLGWGASLLQSLVSVFDERTCLFFVVHFHFTSIHFTNFLTMLCFSSFTQRRRPSQLLLLLLRCNMPLLTKQQH
jgi:hypothetical protein